MYLVFLITNMNRMAKKTRKQKGGGFFSRILNPRSTLPTDVDDPNYLIDLMLYRGTDEETLQKLEEYPRVPNPFRSTSHKGESLLDMAHKREKVKVVRHLLLEYCEPMTAECYWKAINFIKEYRTYTALWEEINSIAHSQNINVLDPEIFERVYPGKKLGKFSELIDKSSLDPFLAKDGEPGLILPTTGASYRPGQNSTPLLTLGLLPMGGGKRTRKRRRRGRFRRN